MENRKSFKVFTNKHGINEILKLILLLNALSLKIIQEFHNYSEYFMEKFTLNPN